MNSTKNTTDGFRDSLSTLDEKGRRRWIYAKKPKGKFTNWRRIVAFILLALLFILPFIEVNGDPLILFNFIKRKIIIFGIPFTPQDLHIFAIGMLSLIVFIVLFTAVFGRIFCGWMCPQTIFMEMLYRPVEYLIEGDVPSQKRLYKAPWTASKIFKKVLKHLIFLIIAFVIINMFFVWVLGYKDWFPILQNPGENTGVFGAMVFFSVVFYIIFSNVREQICTNICPYGRLQGVLLNDDSVIVHYDFIRGEPRGKQRKGDTEEKGDCIDCKLCVQVCPTGIDIRNGTQLECVNCTACIDACDAVMDKINRPQGLIRYDSYNGIKKGEKKIFTSRALAYTAILAILVGLFSVLLIGRADVETVILRAPNTMFQVPDDNHISNIFNYQLINKTNREIENIEIKLKSPEGNLKFAGDIHPIGKQDMSRGTMIVELENSKLTGQKTKVVFEVFSEGVLISEGNTNFLGPIN